MTIEEFLGIFCAIWCIVCLVCMAWCRKNTYVLGIGWAIKNSYKKYKEQKVGVRTRWWRR